MEAVVTPEIIADLQSHFSSLASTQGVTGAIGELTAHLASGRTDHAFFEDIIDRYDLAGEQWFAPQRLDLLIGFANECLENRELLHATQLGNLRVLKSFLQISDGEFLHHRPSEIAHILREQLRIVLADAIIDDEEDMYLVTLQALFGLGYDDFLTLTRAVFENVWAELQLSVQRQDVDTETVATKMKMLEPVVRLAALQYRSLGALNS
ncbi:MAG: hypothetical protein ABJB66_18330 [Gemmatimonadaceae bacterium]